MKGVQFIHNVHTQKSVIVCCLCALWTLDIAIGVCIIASLPLTKLDGSVVLEHPLIPLHPEDAEHPASIRIEHYKYKGFNHTLPACPCGGSTLKTHSKSIIGLLWHTQCLWSASTLKIHPVLIVGLLWRTSCLWGW